MATTAVSSASAASTAAIAAQAANKANAQKIITALSAGSGVDVAALAQGLVDAERAPQENLINSKIAKNEARVSGYAAISFMLKAVNESLLSLKDANSFNASSVSNSNTSAVAVTALAGSAAGNYSVQVNSLALPQRSMSSGFASATASLNGGRMFDMALSINGATAKSISIANGSDTPQGLVSAINAASLGVAAQLVNTGDATDPYKIVLTGSTGAAQAFTLASPATSLSFSSPNLSLNNGASFPLTLQLNGVEQTVTVPAGSDTPAGVVAALNAINPAPPAQQILTAKLVDTGLPNEPYQIVVSSNKLPPETIAIASQVTGGTGTAADPYQKVAGMDFSTPMAFSSLQTAADASLTVEGVTYKRASNTITNVISGLTLDLKATTTAATAANISLSRDTAAIKTKITALVAAYNDVNNILTEVSNPKSTLDTYGGTLVGDSVVRQVRTQLRDMMMGASSSPGTSVGALWQMGLNVDRAGVMSVDATKLDAALANNFDDVVKTFTANQNNRSANSPPYSTSTGFSSGSTSINGGAAFSLTLTGSTGTFDVPISAANATPQGVVDAINASNQGFTAQLVQETSGSNPYKIMVMGTSGSSGFTLTAQVAGAAVPGLSFSGNGSGIAGDALRKITALLSPTGALLAQSENANTQAEKLKVTLAALQTRMQAVLERYTKQFSAMESLVGNINSQKASLKSSFDGMMAMYTNK
jgi:flagellar hook-associated protein 2